MFRSLLPVALTSGIVLLGGLAAQAAPFKDAGGNVHFQDAGQTPGLSLSISTGELSRKLTANFCGLLVINKPNATTPIPATINLNLVATDTSAFPTLSLPTCLNNALSEPRPTNFKTADGRIVLAAKTPGIQYTVGYPGVPTPKSVSVNGCGYGKITNSTTNPIPATFAFKGTTYTVASLPTQVPNLCLTAGGISTRYGPLP